MDLNIDVARIVKNIYLILFIPLACYSVADPILNIFPPGLIDKVENEYNKGARERVEKWKLLVVDSQLNSEKEQLNQVNRFFNLVRFMDDIRVWGKEDYWATPVEFLGRNAGDCEDFAIAKYFTLRALGIS